MCYVCTGQTPDWVTDDYQAMQDDWTLQYRTGGSMPYHAAVLPDGVTFYRDEDPQTWDMLRDAMSGPQTVADEEINTSRAVVRISVENRLRAALARTARRAFDPDQRQLMRDLDDILHRAQTAHMQNQAMRAPGMYPAKVVVIMGESAGTLCTLLERLSQLGGPRNMIKFIGIHVHGVSDHRRIVEQLTSAFAGVEQIQVVRLGDAVAPHSVERLLALFHAEEVTSTNGDDTQMWTRIFRGAHRPTEGQTGRMVRFHVDEFPPVQQAERREGLENLVSLDRMTFVASTADPAAPTRAEIDGGTDLGAYTDPLEDKPEDLTLIGAVYYTRAEVARMDMARFVISPGFDPGPPEENSGRAFSWPSSLSRAPHWNPAQRTLRVYADPYGERFMSYREDELEVDPQWV